MKARVSEEGVLIPKEFFVGVEEVEIQQQNNTIVVIPILTDDPITQLGTQPIEDELTDAASQHDRYIYDL